jgi:heptosyltransferase-3
MAGRRPRILIFRRDNIGDLVCTMPLVHALRKQLPGAHLAALVTHYNAAVLATNKDLDAVYSYTKAKHRADGESITGLYLRRLGLLRELRRERFDWVLLPGGAQASSVRTARWLRAERTLTRNAQDTVAGSHEVEQCCHLLVRMGLRYEAPPARIAADSAEVARVTERMHNAWGGRFTSAIGLHISARKASQQWPPERFADLARRLYASTQAPIMLLWAPGSRDNPLHPGDDEKVDAIVAAANGVPMLPFRTEHLAELIAALSCCERVICSDGGAMHLAAALGKPIVCLFGNSTAARWRPWGVPHELLQPPSLDVADIPVDQVLAAYARLAGR